MSLPTQKTFTKSGDVRCCLPKYDDVCTQNMDAREKQPGVFLTFAKENHTLSTYLGIKLFKIGTNEMYDKPWDDCKNICSDI